MSTTLSVRLPPELAKDLNNIARDTERTRSFHVKKALESYIEDFEDLRIALDRLDDTSDSVISGKDLRNKLGL